MQLLVDTGGSCLQTPGEAMNALSQCESHIAISWSVINRRLGTFLVSSANGNEKRICKPSFKINFEAACVRISDKFTFSVETARIKLGSLLSGSNHHPAKP